ncbi:hypothetical protein EV361DRAFT_1002944 [Lentinula raphanica]|nr:hypothetical protein EV361DRAFT_1002944 [Lentinula raphanica]
MPGETQSAFKIFGVSRLWGGVSGDFRARDIFPDEPDLRDQPLLQVHLINLGTITIPQKQIHQKHLSNTGKSHSEELGTLACGGHTDHDQNLLDLLDLAKKSLREYRLMIECRSLTDKNKEVQLTFVTPGHLNAAARRMWQRGMLRLSRHTWMMELEGGKVQGRGRGRGQGCGGREGVSIKSCGTVDKYGPWYKDVGSWKLNGDGGISGGFRTHGSGRVLQKPTRPETRLTPEPETPGAGYPTSLGLGFLTIGWWLFHVVGFDEGVLQEPAEPCLRRGWASAGSCRSL